jgi:hypothetical protein
MPDFLHSSLSAGYLLVQIYLVRQNNRWYRIWKMLMLVVVVVRVVVVFGCWWLSMLWKIWVPLVVPGVTFPNQDWLVWRRL